MHASDRLDYPLMCEVCRAGYSRVPVFHDTEDHVVGLLFLKDLVLITPAVRMTPAALGLCAPSCVCLCPRLQMRTPVIAIVRFFPGIKVSRVFEVCTHPRFLVARQSTT